MSRRKWKTSRDADACVEIVEIVHWQQETQAAAKAAQAAAAVSSDSRSGSAQAEIAVRDLHLQSWARAREQEREREAARTRASRCAAGFTERAHEPMLLSAQRVGNMLLARDETQMILLLRHWLKWKNNSLLI